MRLARFVLIALLIVVPAVIRAEHFERSLVPMGALALFCGARFRNHWLAFAIPLASMLLGDVLIGQLHHDMSFAFHAILPIVYGCYALNVLLGMGLRRYWSRLKSPHNESQPAPSVLATRVVPIAGTTLGGAVIFFLVTNFADWYLFDSYAKSWRGLTDCYVAAIPFFSRGTLLADMLGTVLFFGTDYLLEMHAAQQADTERA